MKLCFKAYFNTDGDFTFDENQIQERFRVNKSLYKDAKTTYNYRQYDEHINIVLTAEGDKNACRWYVRDLLEELMCSIRTSKHYLIKDLYELFDYFHKDLWISLNQSKQLGLSGNYSDSKVILSIEEEEI